MLIVPRLIALDSSIIGNVARDYYHSNQQSRNKAIIFLDYLYSQNLIPLVVWHHIEELLQHKDDKVICDRMRFIRNLPMIAWFDSINQPGMIGSIMDIQAIELSWLISNPSTSLKEIIQQTKNKLLRFGTGKDLIPMCDEKTWEQIREALLPIQERRREIASISHAIIGDKKPISSSNWQLRRPEEAMKALEMLQHNLESDLINRGDKKLSEQKLVAQRFIRGIYEHGVQFYQNKGKAQEIFLKSFSINPEEISGKATMEDIGYAAIFKAKLKILSKMLDVDYNTLKIIKENHCPSWLIWKEVDKTLKSSCRTSGSDITDKYLSVLSLYADFIVVDKRLHEAFRQIVRQNMALRKIINNIIRLSDYRKISVAIKQEQRQ